MATYPLPLFDELSRCRDWIQAALDHGGNTHDFEDIVRAIYEGRMQLWAGPIGCVVTEIVSYPKKKVLHVFLGGGDMQQLLDFHESVEAFGKANGCEAMTISGRLGWKRVLADFGWEPVLMTLERKIQ